MLLTHSGGWAARGTCTLFDRRLVLLLLLALAGCTGRHSAVYGQTRAVLAQMDDFGMLLLHAGIRAEALLADDELTVEEAHRLWLLLSFDSMDGGMHRMGPRTAATYLLVEAALSGGPVPRRVLNERMQRFEKLAVLRPDGCLAMALTGAPLQCFGPVQVQDGALRAGEFLVGGLYSAQDGGFRLDTSLPRLPHTTFHNGVVVTVEPE
jgi:hypothetical protein